MNVGPWTQTGPSRWERCLPDGSVLMWAAIYEGPAILCTGPHDTPPSLATGPTFSRHATLEDAKRAGDEWLAEQEARRAASERSDPTGADGGGDVMESATRPETPYLMEHVRCSHCGRRGDAVVLGHDEEIALLCRPCVEAALRLFVDGR